MHEFLNVTGPHYWWVDPVRYYVIFAGFACFVEAVIVLWKHRSSLQYSRIITVSGFGLFGLYASVQELEQLGQRIMYWRLPSLIVISTVFLVSLYLHLRGRSTVPN